MAKIMEEPGLRSRVLIFDFRFHAGELIAEKLREYERKEDAYVLSIRIEVYRWYMLSLRGLNSP